MVQTAVNEATGRHPEKRAKNDVSDREVVVLGSGNLGLIYLMEAKHRLTLEELQERHPRLLATLREHPHIGWLLVHSAERGAVVLGPAGTSYLERGTRRGRGPAGRVLAHRGTAPASHGRLRPRGGHHGRQLLRPGAGRRVRLRGADLLPWRARRPADAALHPVLPGLAPPAEPIIGAAAVHALLLGWREGLSGGAEDHKQARVQEITL